MIIGKIAAIVNMADDDIHGITREAGVVEWLEGGIPGGGCPM